MSFNAPSSPVPPLGWRRALALVAIGNGATLAYVAASLVYGFGNLMAVGGFILLPNIVLFVSPCVCTILIVASLLMTFFTKNEDARDAYAANAKGAGLALLVAFGVIVGSVLLFIQTLE